MKYKNSMRKTVGFLLFMVMSGVIGWLYAGFYAVDPYAVGRWAPYSRLLLIGFRVGIPLFIAMIVWLVWLIRKEKIVLSNLLLTLGTVLVCLFIVFPFGKARFQKMLADRRNHHSYHPYLQLSPPFPVSNDTTRFRIYCLGGSTTEWKDAEGRGWPVRLQSLLNRGRTDAVRVENLGCQWYTTQHTLINYAVNLRPCNPDVLLVMHTINDLLHNADFSYFSAGPFRRDYGHFYGPLSRLMMRKSRLRQGLDLLGHFWYHTPREVVTRKTFAGLGVFEQNLNSLIDLAVKDGVRVILMTQPNLYKADISEEALAQLDMLNYEAIGETRKWAYDTALEGFRQYTEVVRKVAKDRGVKLIDLESAIPKTLEYFKDDVHYREKGYDAVAEEVAKALIERGVDVLY